MRILKYFFPSLLLLLFAFLQYRLWQPSSGLLKAYRLQEQAEKHQQDLATYQQRNDALRQKLAWLRSDPAAVEHYARTELGMVKPNETFFVLVEGG